MEKDEAVRKHREMWNAIADKIEARKHGIDIYKEKCRIAGRGILNNCFCCEFARTEYDEYDVPNCDICPMIWPSDSEDFMCKDTGNEHYGGGLYQKCVDSVVDWEKQAQLARQIANLPEKQGREPSWKSNIRERFERVV